MTNHDELCEKVLPYPTHDFETQGLKSCLCLQVDRDRELLKQALNSGLLCDGKELEEVRNSLRYSQDLAGKNYKTARKYLEEISSLKLKLSEAEKENEVLRVEGKYREVPPIKAQYDALLKASEGMEKALEANLGIAWDENSTPYKQAKSALADFRAVKEGK